MILSKEDENAPPPQSALSASDTAPPSSDSTQVPSVQLALVSATPLRDCIRPMAMDVDSDSATALTTVNHKRGHSNAFTDGSPDDADALPSSPSLLDSSAGPKRTRRELVSLPEIAAPGGLSQVHALILNLQATVTDLITRVDKSEATSVTLQSTIASLLRENAALRSQLMSQLPIAVSTPPHVESTG